MPFAVALVAYHCAKLLHRFVGDVFMQRVDVRDRGVMRGICIVDLSEDACDLDDRNLSSIEPRGILVEVLVRRSIHPTSVAHVEQRVDVAGMRIPVELLLARGEPGVFCHHAVCARRRSCAVARQGCSGELELWIATLPCCAPHLVEVLHDCCAPPSSGHCCEGRSGGDSLLVELIGEVGIRRVEKRVGLRCNRLR